MLSLILAAGNGTRMKSDKPKVLHLVNGKPMLKKVIDVCENFGEVLLVLGYKKDEVLSEIPDKDYIYQEQRLGTGHAVMISKDKIKSYDSILITYGDGPLLTYETIKEMQKKFNENSLDAIVLTCIVDNPYGYGRIIKKDNNISHIVEEKEATEDEKKINEINVGVYIFKTKSLLSVIDKLDNNNSKGEYYLTDIIKLLNDNKFKTNSYILKDKNEMLGVNSKEELAIASEILRKRKLKELMNEGVIIIDPNNTYIEEEVEIGADSVIYPNTIITHNSKIGSNVVIYSSRIEGSIIADNCKIDNSTIEYSNVSNNVSIGPYAHLRKGSILKDNVHIGNFVEVKNATIASNVKAGHLSYLGDCSIDTNTNIGAGTITCNFDGKIKHHTNIGKNTFIGSNTIIVSPVNIGDNVITGAGSVITKDIDNNKLAIARSRQINLERRKEDQ